MNVQIIKDYNKKAFTLAEVLITLMIIGIISSIVIPNVISDMQDQNLKVTWKKTFADFNQSVKVLMIDNGGSLKGVFGNYQNGMVNKFTPYMNFVKVCTPNNTGGNCWHKPDTYRGLEGNFIHWENTEGMVLNSGVLVRFDGRNPDSYNCSYICSSCTNLNEICGWVSVDVNGFKSPNQLGKDIFDMWILNNRIIPFGIDGDGKTCSGDGRGCSALYLKQ